MIKTSDNTNLGYLISKIKAAFWPKTDVVQVSIDSTPTENSPNLVGSGGVYSFVGDPIVSISAPATPDGTLIATKRSGDTITIDLNHSHPQYALKVEVATTQPAGGLTPNTLYNLGTLTGTVTLSFASPSDNTIENEYKFTFDAGSTAPTVNFPASVTTWQGNCVGENGSPVISASKHYEVSVIGAYGIIIEF